jgi:hypothetical protein
MKTAEKYNYLKINKISLINLIDGYLMIDKLEAVESGES